MAFNPLDQKGIAVPELEVQEVEDLRWAQDTRCRMISLLATSGPTSSLSMKVEEARIKNLFGCHAPAVRA